MISFKAIYLLPLAAVWVGSLVIVHRSASPDPEFKDDQKESRSSGRGVKDRSRAAANTTVKSSLLSKRNGGFDSMSLLRPMTSAEAVDCLQSGLTSTDDTERDLLISQALAQVTSGNAAELWQALLSNPGLIGDEYSPFEKDKVSVLDRFMLAWGRVDGRAAMASGETRGLDYAIRGWAETDPNAVIAYLKDPSLSDSQRAAYFIPLVKGVAVGNLERVSSLFSEAGRERDEDAIAAVAEVLKSDQAALLAWADVTVNGVQLNPDYVREVLESVTDQTTAPKAVMEWMERNPSAPYEAYHVAEVVRLMTLRDPLAALDWVNRSSDPRISDRLNSVLQYWTYEDASAAVAWAKENLDDPRTKTAITHMAGPLAKKDLSTAVELVAQLDPAFMTPILVGDFLETWTINAPDEALRWVSSLENASLQASALAAVAKEWPAKRLGEFENWMATRASEPRYDEAWSRLALRVSQIDPMRAIE